MRGRLCLQGALREVRVQGREMNGIIIQVPVLEAEGCKRAWLGACDVNDVIWQRVP